MEEDFTDFSDLAGLADVVVDFLLSAFLGFFSAGPLKPEVVWPSTTPTTDTSARSARVGLRVCDALAGVDDLASFFSFLSLYEGVDNWAFCSEDNASQYEQAAGGVSIQGSEPFFLSRQRAQSDDQTLPSCGCNPPRRWLGEDIIVYNMCGSN